MEKIIKKREEMIYPKCPRYLCYKCSCFPYGISSKPGETIRMFCPNCTDIYTLKDENFKYIDGSWFGSAYIHQIFSNYPEIIPKEEPNQFEPRIFGFKIYQKS